MRLVNAPAVDRLLGFDDFVPPPPTGPLFDAVGKARNQWPVLIILTIVVAVTMSPLGVTGHGLYGLVLLIVNVALATVRLVGPDRLSARNRFLILCVAALFGALLIGFDPSSGAAVFCCYTAGHAGYSLPTRAAVVVAVCCSVFSAISVALHHGTGYLWAWQLLVGLTVLFGMTRQNRQQLLQLADEKVVETQRAAAAEGTRGAHWPNAGASPEICMMSWPIHSQASTCSSISLRRYWNPAAPTRPVRPSTRPGRWSPTVSPMPAVRYMRSAKRRSS
jgi:hypothetical protein